MSFSLSPTSSPSPPLSVSVSLLLRSALLPTGKGSTIDLLRLVSLPGPHLFRDTTLPVTLTGPHVLHSLLLSPLSETLDTSSLAFSRSDSYLSPRRSPSRNKSFKFQVHNVGATDHHQKLILRIMDEGLMTYCGEIRVGVKFTMKIC
ncbi:hypothetical protein J5N97_009402 [Dioscorea zingiberensis]|uniref:Uncharacterized protein n=1 Tax=Dioscorea zingiberensis TaxID=325984 RepID=A0A9D5CYP6_9LILI|nr:hypothetical protein J5N97_009402 [Dioscorea zingiberensis]